MDTATSKNGEMREKRVFIGFSMVLCLLLLSGLATALPPTTPSTLAPVNNSVYFNDPTLTCSGSTDPEGDDIDYWFYADVGSALSDDDNYNIDDFNRASLSPNPYTSVSYTTSLACGSTNMVNGNTALELVKNSGSCNNVAGSEQPLSPCSNPGGGCSTGAYEDFDVTLELKDVSFTGLGAGLHFLLNQFDYTNTVTSGQPYFNLDHNGNIISAGVGGDITFSSYTVSAGTNYTLRFKGEYDGEGCTGQSKVYFKVWKTDTETEPLSWLITTGCLNQWNTGSSYNKYKLRWGHGNSHTETYWIYNITRTGETLIGNSTSGTLLWNNFDTGSTQSWSCNACDNNSECSNSTDSRSISKMNFVNCTSGDVALNFTIKDEENESALVGDLDFDVTLSSSQDAKTYNFGLTGNSNYNFCLNPADNQVEATGVLEYLPDSGLYTYNRQYYLKEANIIGNTTNSIDLYSLVDSLASAVTFYTVRAGSAVASVLIHLQRYNPATGIYTLVAMGESSQAGIDVISLRLSDAYYRVLAYESTDYSALVYDGGAEHISSSPYYIYLSSQTSGGTNNWPTWNNLMTDISYNMTYSNVSGNMVLTYDDSSGLSSNNCLKVVQYTLQNGTDEVCYTCDNSASSTISCNIGTTDGYFVGNYVAYSGNVWAIIDSLTVDLSGRLADLIGSDGLFYAFLLVGIISFAFLWSAEASIFAGLGGLMLASFAGVISIGWGVLLTFAIGALVIAMKMNRR